MNDKKYLFVLDLSVGRDFADSVVESFMRRAFFTEKAPCVQFQMFMTAVKL